MRWTSLGRSGDDSESRENLSAHMASSGAVGFSAPNPPPVPAPGEDSVWRLKKGLCGLVQAGRTCNEELNTGTLRM